MGVAGDRKGDGARLAEPARREVEVDDRVHLIGAAGRLVDPLTEQGDGARRSGEQLIEAPEVGGVDVARLRYRPQIAPLSKLVPEIGGPRDIPREPRLVARVPVPAVLQ